MSRYPSTRNDALVPVAKVRDSSAPTSTESLLDTSTPSPDTRGMAERVTPASSCNV